MAYASNPDVIPGKFFQKREEHYPDITHNMLTFNSLQIGIGLDTIKV